MRIEDGNLKIEREDWMFGVGKSGIWFTYFGKKYAFDFAIMWMRSEQK